MIPTKVPPVEEFIVTHEYVLNAVVHGSVVKMKSGKTRLDTLVFFFCFFFFLSANFSI
jgi:hypothetical protein